MFDTANSHTPVAVPKEDQPLVKAIDDARRQYGFCASVAERLRDAFSNPQPHREWIVDLCDPAPRPNLFVTDDDLAAFTREVSTKGRDSARWADLSTRNRALARQIKRFWQDKRRVWMGHGRSQNVDRALVLYVIRRIEEITGIEFRFSRPARLREAIGTLGPARLGGPMLRLAESALHRLFHIADRTDPRRSQVLDYLGWVSPAPHYTLEQIAHIAKLARRARRTTPGSPVNWSSDLILNFRSEVRSELADKARPKNKDQGSASPNSWDIAAFKALVANPWVDLREALEAAAAAKQQTPGGVDVLQANIKSGVEPDLIELAKRNMPRFDDR